MAVSWQAVSDVTTSFAATFGLLLTGIGLLVAAKQLGASTTQLKVARRIAGGEFILHLDDAFRHHEDVHRALRPGGKWASGAAPTKDDYPDIERYMGMFERLKIFVDDGLIDIETADHLYGYRIRNLVANPHIVEAKELVQPAEWAAMEESERRKHGWHHFIELWHQLQKRWDIATAVQ
jgi:hypothetical protein